MKKSRLKIIISLISVLTISLFVFAGCNSDNVENKSSVNNIAELSKGGVLVLKVNPEIAIEYDENGNVVNVTARNEDAKAILEGYVDFAGKPCKTVATELVGVIGKAGYFIEEIEGEPRKITIEIETGSGVPDDTFLQGVADEITNCVSENNWNGSINVLDDSDYGGTDYDDTDYEDTDYKAPQEEQKESDSIAGEVKPNNGSSDNATNQGKTDYNDTDYDDTDYDDTDYDDSDYDASVQDQNVNINVSPEKDQNTNNDISVDATTNDATGDKSNIIPKE